MYRARSGPLANLNLGDRLRALRGPRQQRPARGRLPVGGPSERKGITPKRVILAVLGALLGWILLSFVVFLISAQTSKGVSGDARDALASGGPLLTGSTILVLGSDERPGPDTTGGRADSILLLRVGFGTVRRLSLLRDSVAEIPGHGPDKINAAYAIGGSPLMIDTVEGFLGNGLEVNHLVEVNFDNFPRFIDAVGGVDVDVKGKVVAAGFDAAVTGPDECAPGKGEEAPPEGFRLDKGECHLDGAQALTFARIRQNQADPGEDDADRAARQQAVVSGIRSQLLSPSAFVRLPWIAWQAPRTIRSDLRGPGLTLLFVDVLTGGTGKTRVLEPSGVSAVGGGLAISEEERASAVEELLGN